MQLIIQIQNLRNSEISKLVNQRMSEFKIRGESSIDNIFSELCFCILTANFSAQGGIKIQEALGGDCSSLTEEELKTKLKELGHRFPNMRAKFIVEAREHKEKLKEVLSNKNEKKAREWLVENIKGISWKESSHFLRNIGFNALAIIDFHILDILSKNGLIEKPKSKSLNERAYLEIEQVLEKLADNLCISLGELDLYLWYLETGKVLK